MVNDPRIQEANSATRYSILSETIDLFYSFHVRQTELQKKYLILLVTWLLWTIIRLYNANLQIQLRKRFKILNIGNTRNVVYGTSNALELATDFEHNIRHIEKIMKRRLGWMQVFE